MIGEFDPRLVEEAVFLEMRKKESEDFRTYARFRADLEAAYGEPEPDRREEAFRTLHERLFHEIGLEEALLARIGEFPLLRTGLDRIAFLRAERKKEEGAELFVNRQAAPGGAGHPGQVPVCTTGTRARTAVCRLRPETVIDPEARTSLLRREFQHLSDMVDPAFQYEPNLGPAETAATANLIRDRYRTLWDLYVEARLARRGALPADTPLRRKPQLEQAFKAADPEQREAFYERVTTAETLTHSDLVSMSTNPG